MKQFLLLILLLTGSQYVFSQEESKCIKIDSEGKLLSLPQTSQVEISVDSNKQYTIDKNKGDWDVLNAKFKTTAKLLKDKGSDLYHFYNFIGITTASTIAKDMEALSTAIEANNRTEVTLTQFPELKTILTNTVLTIQKDEMHYKVFKNDDNIKIKRNLVFNTWQKGLVKTSYETNKEALKLVDEQTFLSNITLLQFLRTKVDSLLNEFSKPEIDNNEKLVNVAKELNKYIKENEKIIAMKTLLQKDWFVKQSWMNNGELRMNPIDSKPKEFIITYTPEAQQRAQIFNAYIEKLLENYKQKDTVGNVDKFKAILALRNTGGQIYKSFNFKELNASVMGKPYKELKPDSVLLNQISIKSLECRNRSKNFFADKEQNEVDEVLKRAIMVEDSVLIFVQNVAKSEKTYLDTSTMLITDRSKFQEGLGQAAEDAANIGAFALSLSQFTGLLPSTLFTASSNNVSFSSNAVPESAHGTNLERLGSSDPIDFENANVMAKQELILLHKFEPILFAKTQNKVAALISSTFNTTVTENNKKKSEPHSNYKAYKTYLMDSYFKDYDENVAQSEKEMTDTLKLLSKNLTMLCEVFSKSSLPHKLFDKSKALPVPEYSTKTLKVETGDKPAQYTVVVNKRDDSDTIKIAKFKFRTGKGYRIQLGAGLAYSTRFNSDKPLVQTTITEKDGAIEIKNTYQPLRFVAGIHFQFGKKGLHLQNNGFILGSGARNIGGRTSFFLGVGIPKPLENLYTGFGLDLWPGLKLTVGCHLYRNDLYQISNNHIVEQKTNFNGAPFIGVNIDPTALIKALDVIKKNQ